MHLLILQFSKVLNYFCLDEKYVINHYKSEVIFMKVHPLFNAAGCNRIILSFAACYCLANVHRPPGNFT